MAQKVRFEALRSTAFGSITSSFVAVGTPFANPIRILCLTNTSNAAVIFSIDGTNEQLIVPAGSFKLFDFTTNKLPTDSTFALPAHTSVYVKYVSAPSSGGVYVEGVHGE